MTQSLARSDYDQSFAFDSLRKVIYDLQAATDVNTLSEVVSTYIQTLGYELTWISLYDSGSETLEGPWFHPSDSRAKNEILSVLPGDLFDQVLLTRRTATIPSLQEESRVGPWQHLAKKLNIQGAILQTIRYRKESLGILLIGTSKWGVNPRQDESEQFAILANTLGGSLKLLNSGTQSFTGPLSSPIIPSYPLQGLLQAMAQSQSWDEQLTVVTQELINTHPSCASGLYLLDPESGDFVTYHVHTGQVKRAYRSKTQTHSLTFHQNLSFFKTLERHQNLGLSDVRSNFGVSAPASLVTFLNIRALLLQAIIVDGTLKGFLFLGHSEPTNWVDADRDMLIALSNFVCLTYPSSSRKIDLEALDQDSHSRNIDAILPSPLSDSEDWEIGISHWFKAMTKQFQCQWSLLLAYDTESKGYRPTQYFNANRRLKGDMTLWFNPLSPVDEKLLLRSESAIAFTDLKEELRLLAWRDSLFSYGIQSVLAYRVSEGDSLNEVILLGNTTVRAWTTEDANVLKTLVIQLRQARQRREIHLKMLQEQRLNQVFRQGLQILQTSRSSQIFLEKASEILVDLFEANSCGIILSPPQKPHAKVKAFVTANPDQISISVGAKVEHGDDFLQRLIAPAKSHDAILKPVLISSEVLSSETRSWLSTRENWSILGVPLQPQPRQSVMGVLFLAHPSPLALTEGEIETLSDFARHMAWVLCSSHTKEAWRKEYETLHTAHWYHQTSLAAEMGKATELIPPINFKIESLTLVRLLRELLDQLEPVFASRQIWVQVHHLKQSNLALKSSKSHLLAVLEEVLKAAVARSEEGGRIDIWCRMSTPEWLDLSITDGGSLPPRFVRDLQLGHHCDRLRPSAVANDLGHRLLACKSMTQLLGGKLEFQSLEDNRSLTRFALPCVTH